MNFLAHLALAAPTDASRIGNILGDFEKGTEASLHLRLPAEVVTGIMMHRHLDRFTDDHPTFPQARLLLAPERRRFAGIVVDIFYDYFLHQHWSRFHPGTTEGFISDIYDIFDRHPNWLGREFPLIVPKLRRENWLASYGTLEGIDKTLQRITARSPHLEPISTAIVDLEESEAQFEELFLTFYPSLRIKAAQLLGQSPPLGPSFP